METKKTTTRPVDISSSKNNSWVHNYKKHPPVGIDFGTSNSAIAYWVNTPQVLGAYVYSLNTLGNPSNSKLLSSWVYLEEDSGKIQVGQSAFRNRIRYPERTASGIKRKIGDTESNITLGDQKFSSVELSKAIIKGLFVDPIRSEMVNPAGIVVTVPYYFKQHQNHQTKVAVETAIAEIFQNIQEDQRPKLLGLLPEPIAAAINYAMDYMNFPIDRTILTFDLGGGTLDITIFKLTINPEQINFEVLATTGDAKLGGKDFDQILEDYVLDVEGINFEGLSQKHIKIQKTKIRDAVIEAKEQLSLYPNFELIVPTLKSDQEINLNLKRKDFEELLNGKNKAGKNYGKEVINLIHKSLKLANLKADAIHTVLLVGGSSQIPFFQHILKNTLRDAVIENKKNLFLGVAKGAAIFAAYLLDKNEGHYHRPFDKEIGEIKFTTRTSHSLGIEDHKNRFDVLIPANTKVPAKETKRYKALPFPNMDSETIYVPEIKIFQREVKATQDTTLIGSLKLPAIYRHGRSPEKVPIDVTFEVSDTEVSVYVFVPEGNSDHSNMKIKLQIYLESKN